MRSRVLWIALALNCVSVFLDSTAHADKIDATPGRKYKLTKQHGPWMIMVASIFEPPKERKRDGMPPEEAADKLVLELRKHNIPAYAYPVSDVTQPIETTDRLGRTAKRSYRAQKGGICVMAGNYSGPDDRVAQKTLDYIKSMQPKSWNTDDTIFRVTPGQPKPLSGAFLTINPLLSPEEVAQKKRDTLLLKLNAGSEYSIMDNKGKYTLVVATFSGRSQTEIGDGNYQKALEEFTVTGSLDEAAERAWKVTRLLRDGMFDGRNKGHKYDAYVFHDRYHSIVTVGAFDTPTDPRIEQIAATFGAKTVTDTKGRPIITGESIQIPGARPEPVIFDPKPRLIEVPKLK